MTTVVALHLGALTLWLVGLVLVDRRLRHHGRRTSHADTQLRHLVAEAQIGAAARLTARATLLELGLAAVMLVAITWGAAISQAAATRVSSVAVLVRIALPLAAGLFAIDDILRRIPVVAQQARGQPTPTAARTWRRLRRTRRTRIILLTLAATLELLRLLV